MTFIWKGNIGKVYELNKNHQYYFYGITFREMGVGFLRRVRGSSEAVSDVLGYAKEYNIKIDNPEHFTDYLNVIEINKYTTKKLASIFASVRGHFDDEITLKMSEGYPILIVRDGTREYGPKFSQKIEYVFEKYSCLFEDKLWIPLITDYS